MRLIAALIKKRIVHFNLELRLQCLRIRLDFRLIVKDPMHPLVEIRLSRLIEIL
jgi:hypothetical protein